MVTTLNSTFFCLVDRIHFNLDKRSFFETHEQGPAKPLFFVEICLIKAFQISIFQISVKSEVFDND
ncbi:hypothetical protein CR161_06195 [Prosthecochloris sp. ZM]|nr:hypothetical protein CR161_06195 [Prosthecochloris sp. ZM]